MQLSREEEERMIREYIKKHGVKRLPPFDEDLARLKWRLGKPTVTVNGDGRRKFQKRDSF